MEKHWKLNDCIFDLKNEHLYYSMYQTKMFLLIQGNPEKHFGETLICEI